MIDLAQDPRWRRFTDAGYACACCGQSFGGPMDIGFGNPAPWPHGLRGDRDELRVGTDQLTADACRLGDSRFVRAVLILPVIGTNATFAYGPWASVHPDSFEAALTGNGFEGCFAWLANRLPGWDTEHPLPCNLLPGPAGDRPRLEIHASCGHPLAQAQRDGITFDRLLDIYAAAGHDLRPHLTDRH